MMIHPVFGILIVKKKKKVVTWAMQMLPGEASSHHWCALGSWPSAVDYTSGKDWEGRHNQRSGENLGYVLSFLPFLQLVLKSTNHNK